jgi:hypothetical protein
MKLVLSIALALCVFASPVAAAPVLPNINIVKPPAAEIDVITVSTVFGDQRRLRYPTIIENRSPGRFEIRGERTDTASPMSAVQRLWDSTNTVYEDVPLSAQILYELDDGHQHWHLQNFEFAELLDDHGNVVRASAKHGFCFWDYESLRLKPTPPSYYTGQGVAGCQYQNPDALSVFMGLSYGYRDKYFAGIGLQWIDVTGIPRGHYDLRTGINAVALGLIDTNLADNVVTIGVNIPSGGGDPR